MKGQDYKGDLEEFAQYFMDDEGNKKQTSLFVVT